MAIIIVSRRWAHAVFRSGISPKSGEIEYLANTHQFDALLLAKKVFSLYILSR